MPHEKVRVFYRATDPDDEQDGLVLIYKGPAAKVVCGRFGVWLYPGGEVHAYGEPASAGSHETENLVPWHRVLEVEFS